MTTQMEMDFALTIDDIKAVGKVCVPFDGPIRLDAGHYWIGDLGYVFSDADWDRACEDFTNKRAVRLISGATALIYTTYGDGYHENTSGKGGLFVDSGTIGIVPVSAIEPKEDLGCGFAKAFAEPFLCDMDDEKITFGDVTIKL